MTEAELQAHRERCARMQRINDKLLDELERSLDRPARYETAKAFAWGAASMICGMALVAAGKLFAKHFL